MIDDEEEDEKDEEGEGVRPVISPDTVAPLFVLFALDTKVHTGDVGGMWGEGGSKEFFLFFPSFFLVRNPYYGAWRGRSDDGFVGGVWRYMYT